MKIWTGISPSPAILHRFVFAERIGKKSGYRYDVGAADVKEAVKHFRSDVTGGLFKSKTDKRG